MKESTAPEIAKKIPAIRAVCASRAVSPNGKRRGEKFIICIRLRATENVRFAVVKEGLISFSATTDGTDAFSVTFTGTSSFFSRVLLCITILSFF